MGATYEIDSILELHGRASYENGAMSLCKECAILQGHCLLEVSGNLPREGKKGMLKVELQQLLDQRRKVGARILKLHPDNRRRVLIHWLEVLEKQRWTVIILYGELTKS
jgi:hypothetical protein